MEAGGRPEDSVLRALVSPTPTSRLVDRFAGVSRRRRLVAYASIGSGLVLLRPMLRRVALVALAGLAAVAALATQL
jgi:hypothetical protein